MDYIFMQRVGEVEEEHSFTDLTIDEWLVISGVLFGESREDRVDRHTTTPNKGFDLPAALKYCGRTTTTVYGGLNE